MPFYQRLGDLPRKRHIVHRDNGTLLTEEVMGFEGFSGLESILYHLQSPCRVVELGEFEPIVREEWVPDAHAHRHFRTWDVPPAGGAAHASRPRGARRQGAGPRRLSDVRARLSPVRRRRLGRLRLSVDVFDPRLRADHGTDPHAAAVASDLRGPELRDLLVLSA